MLYIFSQFILMPNSSNIYWIVVNWCNCLST